MGHSYAEETARRHALRALEALNRACQSSEVDSRIDGLTEDLFALKFELERVLSGERYAQLSLYDWQPPAVRIAN